MEENAVHSVVFHKSYFIFVFFVIPHSTKAEKQQEIVLHYMLFFYATKITASI